MSTQVNDHLVLIVGKSATGKSASLMALEDPTGVMYMNCEAGKKLPFPAKFKQATVTDPDQVPAAFEHAETKSDVHTVVVDTLTFLMDMYESQRVIGAANTMAAWGNYAQYFKNLMQQQVASSSKNVIFLAHTLETLNEAEMTMETKVPIKGSLKNNGVEAYFSVVIATKKMTLKALEKYSSPLLTITPEDEMLGYKHVFQTRLTKETVGERIRSPLGMWTQQETFINNDVQLVINRLREYYA